LAFDTSVITEVFPPLFQAGQMLLRWTSSAPAGSHYQVYVGGELAWYGQALSCTLGVPIGHTRIDVGQVGATEQATDFSGSLTLMANLVRLTWRANPVQASDLAGFHVYGESSPGLGISYTTPLATITAVDQGIRNDGYGLGGYGDPAYGSISGSYTWTSGALTRGSWAFAVRSFDEAGNESAGLLTTVAVTTPPRPPAANGSNKRLTYTYNATTKAVTLNWLASPG
jgi:hypothetical protein